MLSPQVCEAFPNVCFKLKLYMHLNVQMMVSLMELLRLHVWLYVQRSAMHFVCRLMQCLCDISRN